MYFMAALALLFLILSGEGLKPVQNDKPGYPMRLWRLRA